MVSTRLISTSAIVAFACVAAANPSPSIENIKNLLARQNDDDDSDDRQCHADCGFTIIQSSESIPSTYCTNQTWVDQLNRCLSCTNRDDDDDIWEDYGSSVSAAAQACGGQTASPGAVLSTDSATGTATAPAVTRISGTATSTGPLSAPTAVGDCHTHGDDLYCIADNVEWEVTSNIDVNNAPDSYDNCRPTDDDDITCAAADGSEVHLDRENDDHADDDHNHGSLTSTPTGTSDPSPSITSVVAGEASNAAGSQTSTQDGLAAHIGGSSIGGVLGLVVAVFAL